MFSFDKRIIGKIYGLIIFVTLLFTTVFSSQNSYADYTLSLTSSGAQSINVSPDYGEGSNIGTSIGVDNIAVTTTCRSGYNFVMFTSVNNNNLYLNGDNTNSASGTYFSPSDGSTPLGSSANTWGYYYNDNSPTTPPTRNNVFNAIPALGSSPAVIKTELNIPSATDVHDEFNIYYGVAVGNGLTPGKYKMIPDPNNSNVDGTVVYRATIATACLPYTVIFNPTSTAGGTPLSGTGSMNPQIIPVDTSATIDPVSFTPPTGYEFDSWNTAQDGTGTSYDDKQQVTNLTAGGQTITLYAQWKPDYCYSHTSELYCKVKSESKGKNTDESTGFSWTSITADTSGVYEWDGKTAGNGVDSNGGDKPIYFYRGILDTSPTSYGSSGLADAYPNYVKLNNDTCWRIVRTTSTGGVKMVFNGMYGDSTTGSCANATSKAQTRYDGSNLTIPFNTASTTKAGKTYSGLASQNIHTIGYTYSAVPAGTSSERSLSTLFGSSGSDVTTNSNSSVTKQYTEDWYRKTMLNYTDNLEGDAGFCQDRQLGTSATWTDPLSEDTTIVPYGTADLTEYYFGPRPRIMSRATFDPLLTCPRGKVDLYSYEKDSGNGNGQLSYPVSLLTADELSLAGSGSNNSFNAYHANSYLNTGAFFWLLSPNYRTATGATNNLSLASNSFISSYATNYALGVRPVISLEPNMTVSSGNGTATNPWVVNSNPKQEMQNLAPSKCTTDPTVVKDNRDSAEYIIQRLADGKCWMLDNLSLGGDSTISLNSSNTNLDAGKTFTLPASSRNNFDSTSGFTNPGVDAEEENTITTHFGVGQGKVGVYYNLCAASAGTYCYESGSAPAGTVTNDICPAGWRMPTGGSGKEFETLFAAYSSSDSAFREAFSATYSGFMNNGAPLFGTDGSWRSSVQFSAINGYYLYVSSNIVSPSATGSRYGGIALRCLLSE